MTPMSLREAVSVGYPQTAEDIAKLTRRTPCHVRQALADPDGYDRRAARVKTLTAELKDARVKLKAAEAALPAAREAIAREQHARRAEAASALREETRTKLRAIAAAVLAAVEPHTDEVTALVAVLNHLDDHPG